MTTTGTVRRTARSAGLRLHAGPRRGVASRSRLLVAALLAAVLPVLAACGSGSDTVTGVTTTSGTESGTPSTSDPTPTAAGTTTAEPAGEPAPTSTKGVTDPAGPTAPAAVLTVIRTADRGSYDRVVLEFNRPFGGYTVQYVDELTEDPTGDPVELAGSAVLAVVVQGATRNNAFQTSDTTPLETYAGPQRVSPNLPNVKEVADAGDFEAVLSFGVGLGAKTGFRVLKLSDPARLVIDVAH
ncbi:MAG: hypothetical protein ACKVZ6_14395 [Kineosporiaceae bacterium]